jgi:hypothetical protein
MELRPRPLGAQRVRPGPPAAPGHVEARDSHPAAGRGRAGAFCPGQASSGHCRVRSGGRRWGLAARDDAA